MTLTRHPEGTQKSGSTGGTVHSHGRYGSYTKSKSRPVNPNSARQSKARCVICKLANDWKNLLTETQREAWNVYGRNVPWKNKLGQTVHLTGFAHFTRSNTARLDADAAEIFDAPIIFNLATPEQRLTCDFIEPPLNQVLLLFKDGAAWADEDDAHQLFYMSRPYSSGIKFYNGSWRYFGRNDGNSEVPPLGPQTFSAVFPMREDQRVTIKSRITRADGRLSEWAYATNTVTGWGDAAALLKTLYP